METAAPFIARSTGTSFSRVDGRLKVTGGAKYPAEFAPQDTLYAWAVTSTISKGTITGIDISAAEQAPGVKAILTHLNAPKLAEPPNDKKTAGIRIEERIPFSDAVVSYGGQYVGLVIADTFENARAASALLKITYATERHALTKNEALETAKSPEKNNGEQIQVKKGDTDSALKGNDLIRIAEIYSTPTEMHNPMECSATVAHWIASDRLTIYDTTQYVKGAQAIVAHAFGLKPENVRVICPYVGGAFGCKGPVWPHTFLAVMAARAAGAPVKLEVTRQQMFSCTGHRTPTFQKIALAARKDGKLQAILHQSENYTSPVGAWIEPCGIGSSNVLYDAPAIEFTHTAYAVNIGQPSFMRAPGECPGTYAMECAMDELACALKMDPVQLRLVNDSPKHPIKGIPWSSKYLRKCFEVGAEKFGWKGRTPEPRSMKDGRLLVGWGVATATYPAYQWEAEVRMELKEDGTALVQCASHDLGTGAYTAFTQISADALGLSPENMKFELGSSDLPMGPVAGGSNSTATVGSAIVAAARKLHEKLSALAVADEKSPLHGTDPAALEMVFPGRLGLKSDHVKSDAFRDILKRASLKRLEATGSQKEEKSEQKAFQSFGAQFCEVKIDPDLPLVSVTRFVSVMDCGRVINLKTGGSQIIGGVVMGIGMALEEETFYDPASGLPVTRNLADYHVPVNADIHAIEFHTVGEPDYAFNPMGARGMGEIGITGAAAAVANAVYHATGKRVRDLPITLDKLL